MTRNYCRSDLVTWLVAVLLEVEHGHVSILEARSDHVRVARVNVQAHHSVGGPALVLGVGGILQGVDTDHSNPIIVLKLI